jgi:hypothetical protein
MKKIKVEMSMADSILHAVMWFVFIIITFGIASLFYPYALSKFVINKIAIYDEHDMKVGHMECDIDIFSNFIHGIIWILLSVITFGLAYLVYVYRVWVYSMGNSRIVSSRF